MGGGVLRWLVGWVRAEAEGGYPERLLNDLTKAGIPVWGVSCRREWTRFSCPAKEYRRLRPYARRACVRMRVRQKHGLPFWVYRYRHRKGLLVGLGLYGLILCLLAPRIWVVDVTGNTKTPTEDILAVVEQMGVAVGERMADMNIKALELNGTNLMPGLSFVTVNPSGCVARVTVTEREPTPDILDLSVPSDVVAARDGRILRIDVLSGKGLVMAGEAVKAGTPLITGRVQSELGEQLYRSYGEVWAETRRQISVSVPLSFTHQIPTGEVIYRPVITFLKWHIPLYSGGPLQPALCRERRHYLQAGDLTLPLGVTGRYYLPTRTEQATRSEAQARELAEEQLSRQREALFGNNPYEELERTGAVVNGMYILAVTYRCEENIALEVPIEVAGE